MYVTFNGELIVKAYTAEEAAEVGAAYYDDAWRAGIVDEPIDILTMGVRKVWYELTYRDWYELERRDMDGEFRDWLAAGWLWRFVA